MSVSCSECGEPIVGNVNRCWRCGNQIQAVADAENKPPVRRRPVVLETEPQVASVVETEPSVTEQKTPRATGMPFNSARTEVLKAAQPAYPENPFRGSLAIASVVAGIMSFIGGFISRWAIIPALIAFFAATYGFKSKKKKIAIAGALLALLTIFAISTQTILSIRTYYQQRNNAIFDDTF